MKTTDRLDDPRAVNILTTEHWSLLSTRSLGYQEMFGRATLFVAVLSATIVAVALLAQATHFGREMLVVAALLFLISLLIGIATFARSIVINYEDARCVAGMALLRRGYIEMVPGVEQYFATVRPPDSLAHGAPQRFSNVARSLTTTSGVIAALNAILTGAFAGDVAALFGGTSLLNGAIGTIVSILAGVGQAAYAARFRKRHAASATDPST